jgi:hypothetical protein
MVGSALEIFTPPGGSAARTLACMTSTAVHPTMLRLEPRTSRLAVVGFALSLFALPMVGIPLCIGALVDCKHGRTGRELAIAGLFFGVLWSVFWGTAIVGGFMDSMAGA